MIDSWIIENLVDPVDKSKLSARGDLLISEGGREYPVIDGIPVMLIPGMDQTIEAAKSTLRRSQGDSIIIDHRAKNLYLETLSISDQEKNLLIELYESGNAPIDPVVMVIIAATSGYAYKHLIGSKSLTHYPIPEIRLPYSNGQRLLDIGCNWGRWSVAATQKGYRTIGIDPQLGAVMAARRVARAMSLDIRFVCADGRHLPFANESFDKVFSYSVLQHLSKPDTKKVLEEASRSLKKGGEALIQMANGFGIRSIQHQAKRNFAEPKDFDVRYYRPGELKKLFEQTIGSTKLSTDCYFGLGWQKSDYSHMPPQYKAILMTSEVLRKISDLVTPMKIVADSLYCRARKS